MSSYSYSELHDMQEKAMERVRDMQKRAKYTAEMADMELNPQPAEIIPKAAAYAPAPIRDDRQKQHHIRMPVILPERNTEYPSFKTYFDEENTKLKQKVDKQHKANLLDEVLKEPDRAMLFSLLLLLKAEGADEAILMSLLYIMS